MPPSAFTVSATAASTAAASVTSTATALAPISLAVALARSMSRSQIATLAPEAMKRSATARPMPCAPPVTTALRPFRSMLFMIAPLSPSCWFCARLAADGAKSQPPSPRPVMLFRL